MLAASVGESFLYQFKSYAAKIIVSYIKPLVCYLLRTFVLRSDLWPFTSFQETGEFEREDSYQKILQGLQV